MAEEIEELRAENERLRRELAASQATIRRAKDATPVQRPSRKRVVQLVRDACMELARVAGGWELRLGNLKRRFRFLKQIWEILTADDWSLGEIFPPDGKGKALPRLPKRYPVLAPWLPFQSVSAEQHSDGTSVPTVWEEQAVVFDLY